MNKCKFCQLPEGAPGRSGKPVHINRDSLCGPCYTLLEKVKYQPDKIDAATMEQFVANCEWNFNHGLFVPLAQRKEWRSKQVWHCNKCGRQCTADVRPDKTYKNYCECCAEDIRYNRNMPLNGTRKARKDKGQSRTVRV